MMRGAVEMERIRAEEVATRLGIEPRQVKALAERGSIPGAAQIGSLWTFDRGAIAAFEIEFPGRKAELIESLKPARIETVYVLRCGYRVKIGFTKNLAQRLHSLRTANHRPIEVLATWPGSIVDEKALHERFSDLRVSGEWFALKKPIKEWLRDEHKVQGL